MNPPFFKDYQTPKKLGGPDSGGSSDSTPPMALAPHGIRIHFLWLFQKTMDNHHFSWENSL